MIAVVGLGSNVGDRLRHMREARARLASHLVVAASSLVYENAPVGGPPQGMFLNAALRLDGDVEPASLLALIQQIERDLGRTREIVWGPRTIDLDVLWIDGLVLGEGSLVVPHPRLVERAFALAPLLDVAPDARDPSTGRPYAALPIDRSSLRPLAEAL